RINSRYAHSVLTVDSSVHLRPSHSVPTRRSSDLSDVYWCTADIGWVTGHTYVVYGPMANRTTQVIYEGTPDFPHQGRWWEIVQKDRKSTRLNSSHVSISYAVFCWKNKQQLKGGGK